MMDLSNPNKTPLSELPDDVAAAMFLAVRNGAKAQIQSWDDWVYVERVNFLSKFVYRIAPEHLVPDTIDWSHVADGFDCMARDICGSVYLYSNEVELASTHWVFVCGGNCENAEVFASYNRGTVDWKDSLVKRPDQAA